MEGEAGPSKPKSRTPQYVQVSSSSSGLELHTIKDGEEKTHRLSIPSNLVWMAPSAAMVGFLIGARRGAARARLRFLAENAHRAPKTVQGWYFYTKTRNYRVMLASLKTGGKYALGFGGAMAAFVGLEEGAGWLRERLEPPTRPNPNQDRYSWRKGPVHIADGAVAGGSLAAIAGLVFRLPNPLLIQGVVISTLMGGMMSGLQHVQDDLYPQVELEHAAKEAVHEIADGVVEVPVSTEGAEDGDKEKQPVPDNVPELGNLGEPVRQQQENKSWWLWK